ncbi:MAG: Molybdate ABC transporter, permease protein [Desulfotomaculum sp. 46_80]|nr:MAG: Molybdate ABC transporter, permease protein [Desulfotomaculum sp. 46_80]
MIDDFSPLWISMRSSACATLITLVFGVAAAWFVAAYSKKTKGFIDSILTLPMILPPTVVGFFLLLIFGKNGFIGGLLEKFNIEIIFSWAAIVIAASVVSFPLMYRTVRAAFEQIDSNILDAARVLGASEFRLFYKVAVPVAWPGIAAGTILSFARSLGEFGATLMVAGNIPGRTQTIPVAIFFAAESGEMDKAYLWVALIFIISLIVMVLMNYWSGFQAKLLFRPRGKL